MPLQGQKCNARQLSHQASYSQSFLLRGYFGWEITRVAFYQLDKFNVLGELCFQPTAWHKVMIQVHRSALSIAAGA